MPLLLLIATHLPVLLGAWCVARRWGGTPNRPASAADLLLSTEIYFATLIGLGLALGLAGLLTRSIAPAYAPSSSELYYPWLLLPVSADTLARAGQFPFWLLLLAAVAGLGRELRLRKNERAWLCAAVALIPTMLAQSATAMTDVAMAAHV